MDRTIFLFRALFLTGCGVGGWVISQIAGSDKGRGVGDLWAAEPWLGAFLGLAIGLFVVLLDQTAKGVSLRAFSSAAFGLAMGYFLSFLIVKSDLFHYVSEETRWIIHLIIYLTFGYLGTMLALRSNRDEFSLLIPYVRFIRQDPHEQAVLLDTSSIIDGRVADLCKSGFLDGTLLIPRFVLDELQSLADSSDANRRVRGRHGLDLLNSLQNLKTVEVKIHETPSSTEPVDSRLIHLARLLNARIVTTDYNLGKIAELQKLRVLNVHLLAGVLRTPVMSGDILQTKLIREGKDPHQAVGYLPDGTMIVVNQAKTLLGQDVDVTVSGVIQTTAGRIVFADLTKKIETP
jgi:uncharacterized protein YacL